MAWTDEEIRGIDLGDKPRNDRAVLLLEPLAEPPTASISGVCNGWAETQAAYRFLVGDGYERMDILEPHRQCTRTRMGVHPVVLCLQDTTELDPDPGDRWARPVELRCPTGACRRTRSARRASRWGWWIPGCRRGS